jgi:CheY-like chemotaxis protein
MEQQGHDDSACCVVLEQPPVVAFRTDLGESMKVVDVRKVETSRLILVVEDVHETRDGIEKLLKADGYRVALARDERDAVESALLKRPDLILVSLAGSPDEVLVKVRRIRERGAIGDQVPVVVFCIEGIGEGEEVAIGQNVFVTRPDNFNQLRGLLARLLHREILRVHVRDEAIATELNL